MKTLTIKDLTNEQYEIIEDYVDLLGCSEEEALAQALAEGAIQVGTSSSYPYKPEGFTELKRFELNSKSNLFKANKAYKKANKKDLFEEENFYININTPKVLGDDGKPTSEYDVENMTATCVGEEPEIIVTNVMYRVERSAFVSGKPLDSNFETNFELNLSNACQNEMYIRSKDSDLSGKSFGDLKAELQKKYGKAKSDIPQAESYSFKVFVYGLLKVDDKYEKVYFGITNRYGEDDNLVQAWDKTRIGIKSNYLSKLTVPKTDDNENPIFKLEVIEKLDKDFLNTEVDGKAMKFLIRDTGKEIIEFKDKQKTLVKGPKDSSQESSNDSDSETDSVLDDNESWDD